MSDEDTTQATTEEAVAPVEPTTPESQPEEQTPAVSEPGQEPQKPAEGPAPTGEPKQEPKAEVKPTSRRSAQFRIQQLVNENNQLKSQIAPKQEQPSVDEWGNTIEPAAETPDPRYAKLEAEIEALKGLVKPVMTSTQKAADDTELSELFTGKPEERTKYEEPIRKMWELPQYKDLAAVDLYKIATYEDAIANARAQAIEEYKKADKEAKESSASGSSSTNSRTEKPGQKTAWDMTEEEFKAVTDKARASG